MDTEMRSMLTSARLKTLLTQWICERVKQCVGKAFIYPTQGSKHFKHTTQCVLDLMRGEQYRWEYISTFKKETQLDGSLLHRAFTVEEIVEGLVRVANSSFCRQRRMLGETLCVPADTYILLRRKGVNVIYSPFLLVFDPVLAERHLGASTLLPVSRPFFDELLLLLRIPQDNSEYSHKLISLLKRYLFQLDKFKLFALKTEQFFQTGMFTGVAFPKKSLERFLVQYIEWLKNKLHDVSRIDVSCFSVYSRLLADFLAEMFPAQKPWMPVSGVFVLQVFRVLARNGAVACVASKAVPASTIDCVSSREWKAKVKVLTQRWSYVPCTEKFFVKICSAVNVPVLFAEYDMLRIRVCGD